MSPPRGPTGFRPTPGRRLRHSAALVALLVTGCLWKYGFAGGGFPSDIKTVAVLPFENQSSDPTLASEINAAVREAVQNRLGLRQAGENQADATVSGTIDRYEPDLPVAFQGREDNRVEVTRRLVQIVVSVTIMDRRNEKPLWERRGIILEGEYQTGQERRGRELALEKLVQTIVDGAQSQW